MIFEIIIILEAQLRVNRVHIRNFRGVRSLDLNNLGDLIVLAGQNGSGKSCVLDAIRLVKSAYGGYQQNEFHHWFGEFGINFSNDPRAFKSLFNDINVPLTIEIDFSLHQEEKAYLKENHRNLIIDQTWRFIVPELYSWRSLDAAPLTAHHRSREAEVMQRAEKDILIFKSEIDAASISIEPDKQPQFNPSKILELVFSIYDPIHFGIVDYHGPSRMYGRETLSSINVNVDALEEQKKQSALYNYNVKYGNIKSEMAALYVKEAIALRSGKTIAINTSITDTLKELFSTFFPEKTFLGPQATEDGSLIFPVKIGERETHDLNELSSGEKEIIYGYLRLRSSAAKNSIILLDEPELHLNPKLTRHLTHFYYKHLAKALDNQIWLVTHSDAILRNSVGRDEYSVFHMTPSFYSNKGENQAKKVEVDHDLDQAVIELVGDMAAYTPGRQIVIFEGENSEFDLQMTSALFPELLERANLISGTNKSRVKELHTILERLSKGGALPKYNIYSIIDGDDEIENKTIGVNRLKWDVYHIENYLLVPKYISMVCCDLAGSVDKYSENTVFEKLKESAIATMPKLILHNALKEINHDMKVAMTLNINNESRDIPTELIRALNLSRENLTSFFDKTANKDYAYDISIALENQMTKEFNSGEWIKTFRGRDILKYFVGMMGVGLKYDRFRNLLLSRMINDGHKPEGMAEKLQGIIMPKKIPT